MVEQDNSPDSKMNTPIDSEQKEGMKERQLIGEILIKDGLINAEQLELALEEQRQEQQYIGVILMRRHLIDEKDLYKCLSDQSGVDFIEIRDHEIPSEVLDKIPRDLALQYSILPIYYHDGELAIVLENPLDMELRSLLERIIPDKIRLGFATRGDLHYAINRSYNNLVRSNPVVRDFYDGFAFLLEQDPFNSDRAIDLIIAASHLLKASDVHLIFYDGELKIGLRIDGTVHNIPLPARRVKKEQTIQIRNSLKMRSSIDAAKKGIPQDGRFELVMDQGTVQARVSVLPLVDGEKMVMRLIGQMKLKTFDDLGLSVYHREKILPVLKRRAGMIVVAGPPGSGKTTSLYALLTKIPTLSKAVVSIEDPVEARLPFAAQVQVNQEKGLTYSVALQSILRQDPDIILLGEIRDEESAIIAVESAMTGHMVLSSVHMEHSVGVILRLLHMGVEPFALASSLSLIIAQRLVPRICAKCRTTHPQSNTFSTEFGLPEDTKLYTGTGCNNCYFTGRSGRVALFEMIVITDDLRDLITGHPTLTSLLGFMLNKGEQTFRDDALSKCHQGLVMPEDVLVYT